MRRKHPRLKPPKDCHWAVEPDWDDYQYEFDFMRTQRRRLKQR